MSIWNINRCMIEDLPIPEPLNKFDISFVNLSDKVVTYSFNPNQTPTFHDTQTYSANFGSSQVPDVEFEVFVTIIKMREINVYLMKTPCDPANAILSIKVDKSVVVGSRTINDWGNNRVVFNHLSYVSGYNTKSITFEIIWLGFIRKPDTSSSMNIYRHLNNLLTTSDLADFIIAVDGEEIPTHKVILASQSPVFLGMFKSNMTESVNNRLDIKHIELGTMKKVITFLYTGEIDTELNVDALLSILAVSNEYQIMDLKNLCEQTLSKKITLNNVITILESADLYDVPKLVEKAIRYMVNKKSAIVQRDDFIGLYRKKSEVVLDFIVRACM